MTFNEREKQIGQQLKEDLELLQKSVEVLTYSYGQCKPLVGKMDLQPEEKEAIEALTARFSRTSDLLTQKIVKIILILLKEDIATFIDRAYFLEKLEIITDAHQLIDIRSLRNEIAHEYSSDLSELFKGVLNQTALLIGVIKSLQEYIENHPFFKNILE